MPVWLRAERRAPAFIDRDLADEVRRLLAESSESERPDWRSAPIECTPTLDLYDTGEAFEIVVDLPGVPAEAVRVLVKHDVVVIVGEKRPPACDQATGARFHLAERAFGRFARAVRLASAIDATRAQASLNAGELHVIVPKVPDRRARDVSVPIVHVP